MELFTVTVDSPVIDTPCVEVGTDAQGLPGILHSLADSFAGLTVESAPAIIEVRRVK